MIGGKLSEEKLKGFELTQVRDRMEVMRLKSRIAAHEAWIEHGSRIAKAAEDALQDYRECGVEDDDHRKYLEKILTDAKHTEHQNKSAVIRALKNLEKLVDDGSKQKLKNILKASFLSPADSHYPESNIRSSNRVMSGFSDDVNESIKGFQLKQMRDRLKVKELKSKITAHKAWIDQDSKMAKNANDALREYEEDQFDDINHRKHLEKIRDEAQESLYRNRDAVYNNMKLLEKIIGVGPKQKNKEKRERPQIVHERQEKTSKSDQGCWAPEQYLPSVSEMIFVRDDILSDGW